MNDEIANALIEAESERLRRVPYSELATQIGMNDTKEVTGPDGNTYILEIEVLWDDKKHRNVRVFVAADDGKGWRAFVPLTRSFIKSVDETFVGESPKAT